MLCVLHFAASAIFLGYCTSVSIPILITAYDLHQGKEVLFTNEALFTNADAVMSTAAPSFPKSLVCTDLVGNLYEFVDSDVITANPTANAIAEAKLLWLCEEHLVLSVGTGCCLTAYPLAIPLHSYIMQKPYGDRLSPIVREALHKGKIAF